MISNRTRAFRLIPAIFAALACAPFAGGEQAAPGQWKGESLINGTAYIPLESIRSFYKLTPVPAAAGGGEITVGNGGISLTFRNKSCEAKIGGYRCRLTHPAVQDERGDLRISKTDAVKLIDPILRPTYIAKRGVVRSIVIDPGHGGHDVGVVGNQVREADFTLLLAQKLRDVLTARGLKVILTRDKNHAVSDRQRVDALAQADAPVFISLHLNNGRSDIKGVETYALQPAGSPAESVPGNAQDEANAALAFCLHCAMVSATGAEDGACRRARFSLLSSAPCPAAMVLAGYASNAEEAAALNTAEYRDKIAQAVADGICAFAKAINPDAKVPVSSAPVDTAPPTPYKADAPAPAKANPPKKQTTPPKKQAPPKRKTPAKPANKGKRR